MIWKEIEKKRPRGHLSPIMDNTHTPTLLTGAQLSGLTWAVITLSDTDYHCGNRNL